MKNLKRMRLLCGLRQIDVWAGTGIPVTRISQAEQGRIQLMHSEEKLLISFLQQIWADIERCEEEWDLFSGQSTRFHEA